MRTQNRSHDSIVARRVITLSALIASLWFFLPACALAQCSTPGNAACPGTLLTTYFNAGSPLAAGGGDSTLELINPVGSANPGFAGLTVHNMCAMIYVFDNNENMDECCGCLLSPERLLSLSAENNLTNSGTPSTGLLEIVSTTPNVNGTCNPSAGYRPTPALNGYILHHAGVAEVQLADAGNPNPALQISLITRCAQLGAAKACSCGL
jgi:hypothetical protein